MKRMKQWFLLLITLVLLLSAACFAEEMTASTADEFSACIAQVRDTEPETFSVTVQPELLAQLEADNYAALHQLCRLADMADYRFRLSTSGTITFQNVVFQDLNIAVCKTTDDVKNALRQFVESGTAEFELHCNADLFASLFTQGGMYRLLNELGIEDCTMKGNSRHQIFLSELQAMTVPCAQVATISEAGEQISFWREENVPAFNLLFDLDAYQALTRDDYRLIAFLGGVDNYRLSYNSRTGMLYFTEVTYSELPGSYCTSEEDVVSAIRAMGARGVSDFQLMLDQPTYDAVYADYFSRLSELQAQAGMTDAQLSYSGVSRLLIFKNAVINADATIFSTMEEVTALVNETAARCGTELSMLLTKELYADLMDGVSSFFVSDAKFYDFIANAGILTADDITFNRQAGAINMRGIRYYAGISIMNAVESGDLSGLTSREQQALDAAREMAEACRRESDVETAKAIHDALCERIIYTDDETTEEDDCCIGALLTGEANCDGYADAMMLVGRLVGLNIRFQHGDSQNDLLGMFSTHMWNLIELDGSWRMIDVTWDDMEGGRLYVWFNIGEDRASLSHTWNADMTVPMLAVTDETARPVAEYFAPDTEAAAAAISSAQADGHTVFEIYFTGEDAPGQIAARELLRQNLSTSFSFVWLDSIKCAHVELVP